MSRERGEMMNSVSVQIQRAINDAISNQVLPKFKMSSWPDQDVSAERPEINPEEQRNLNARNNLRNEQDEGHQNGDLPSHNVHDMVTGDNESPNPVPEFLTGRILSRNHLDQSCEDINLDTTIPAQERTATPVDPDPISRLADALTNMQNRSTAQQLTIHTVNSNTIDL